MARLRNVLLAIALATGAAGCVTFCDECDDFPIPGGPGGYAMMPGSYTGPPLSRTPDAGPVGSPSQTLAAPPGLTRAASTPSLGTEMAPTPPPAPPAASSGPDRAGSTSDTGLGANAITVTAPGGVTVTTPTEVFRTLATPPASGNTLPSLP